MTTQDFIIALFDAVDQERLDVPKHPDPNSLPVQWSSWPCCLQSKAGDPRP
jgi:hypothetical protein